MRKEFRAHADAGIRDGKAKRRLSLKSGFLRNRKRHLSAFWRELNGIAQDIDQYLAQFHTVADIIIIQFSQDMALVIDPFFGGLAGKKRIDGFQQLPERELLVL